MTQQKPEWALTAEKADHLEGRSIRLRKAARKIRCKATDSAGVQCTADTFPIHAHRYNVHDLPGHS